MPKITINYYGGKTPIEGWRADVIIDGVAHHVPEPTSGGSPVSFSTKPQARQAARRHAITIILTNRLSDNQSHCQEPSP